MWIWIRIFAEWLKHKQRKSFIRILGLIERNRENYIIFSVGMANILRISQGWYVVCCWIQKSVENILSEFLFKICLQSIIYGWFRHQKQINASFSCWKNRSVIEQSAAFHLWVVSVHSKHDTWHMSHGQHLDQETA